MTILLLLDMNGTVCYRAEEPVRGMKEDLYIRRKYYYKRQGIEAFIKRLLSSTFFDVWVYTSMMSHNVEAGLNAILPGPRKALGGVLDRAMTKPDPNGADPWDTIRDMDKVWKKLPQYDANNTILLDNEARKFKEHPNNGIVVPEFGALEVRSRLSSTLTELTGYLLELGAAAPADVRAYMKAHPFVPGRVTHTTAAPRAALKAALPTPAAPRLSTAVPSAAAADSLVASLAGLSLAVGGKPASASASSPAPSPATPPRQQHEDRGAGEGGEGDEKVDVAAADPAGARAPADVQVAEGLSLRLSCVDDQGKFVMSSIKSSQGKRLVVRGQVTAGLRVDVRMDYHRLVQEAEAAGVELLVEEQYD